MTSTDSSREQRDTLWKDLWANTHARRPPARTGRGTSWMI